MTPLNGNLALGRDALASNTSGNGNLAIGFVALFGNTSGFRNLAIGGAALYDNTTGDKNIAIGLGALNFTSTGSDNIAIGYLAGFSAPPDASDNIFIGNTGNPNDTGNTIRIGTVGSPDTRIFLTGVDGEILPNGNSVLVSNDGQLGTSVSSRRFKGAIRPLEGVSEELLALEPVTFRYKPELVAGGGDRQVGLIAEEVAKLFPELVTRDEEGRPFGVRYDLLSVVLLEEVQRQHAVNQKQHAELVDLRRRLKAVERRQPPG